MEEAYSCCACGLEFGDCIEYPNDVHLTLSACQVHRLDEDEPIICTKCCPACIADSDDEPEEEPEHEHECACVECSASCIDDEDEDDAD